MFCFCFCSVLVRASVGVCVHACACMCVRVHVRACAVQPASSANALWKTNSVSVDGVSRQRSSSDPPAVHPPLPPLRVTSTSTFFPFSFLAMGFWIWMAGGCSRRPRGESCEVARPQADAAAGPALCGPGPGPSGRRLLSHPHPMPGGAHTLSSSVFPSISATFPPVTHEPRASFPLAVWCFSICGHSPLDIIWYVFFFSVDT